MGGKLERRPFSMAPSGPFSAHASSNRGSAHIGGTEIWCLARGLWVLWQVMGRGMCLDMGIGNTYLEGGLVRILQTSLSLLHGPLIPSLVAVPSSLSLRPSPRRKDTAWSECDGRQRLTETD